MGSSTRDVEIWVKGALGVERLSLLEPCEGNLEGGLPCWDPEGYVEKALETGISFHRGPVWGTWKGGSTTGDFERWMKGALGMEYLSLKRLRLGGLGRSCFTGDPGIYVSKVSGFGLLPP